MKILLISNKVPYPANDGSSIAIRSMAEGLLANGAEVHLLSINTSRHYKRPESTRKALPKNIHFYSINANTDINWRTALVNLLSADAYQVSRFKVDDFRRKLKELLLHHNFDIVQIEGLAMAVYMGDIHKYSNARVSYRAHNVEYLIWERQLSSERGALKRIYLREQINRLKKFEEKVIRTVDILVPISGIDEEKLKPLGAGKPSVTIPCGVNLEDYEPRRTKPEVDLAYIASFDWLPNRRGMEWFTENVWPLIRAQKPGCSMYLAGRNIPEEWSVLNKKGIKIIGEVDSASEFINSARIVLIPLLAGSGMRIKLVEYLALGKAVVSTFIGAEGVEVKDGESVLLADDPGDFASALLQLLDDDELRMVLEKNARSTAENYYDNRALGKKLLQFYSHTL